MSIQSPSSHDLFRANLARPCSGALHREAFAGIVPKQTMSGATPGFDLVREWAMMHTEELLDGWRCCRENTAPAQN